MARSILVLNELSRADLFTIFDKIKEDKAKIKKGEKLNALDNKVVGLLFEKPSTRTRVSFESAVLRLGGSPIYLSSNELQLKRGEPVKDTARILGGYMDILVARVFEHKTVQELSDFSGVSVLNGLSDRSHPTQAICDLYTILEVRGFLKGLTMSYIGDGNNVCYSLLMACALAGMNMNAACPAGYFPNQSIVDTARGLAAKTGAKLQIMQDPIEATKGVDIVYTDTWVSMGEEKEKENKIKAFDGYQVNAELLKVAAKDASVMHCLPAYRGLEITEDVMEGPQSIIWQQGENKMYGAVGILDFIKDL